MSATDLEALLATQAITEVLHRYCHALDTLDRPLADTVWHDDALAFYPGFYEGPAEGLLDQLWETYSPLEAMSHEASNVLAEVDGDSATCASHLTAVLRSSAHDLVVRGRCLDTFSRRGGEWRIDLHRFVPSVSQQMAR